LRKRQKNRKKLLENLNAKIDTNFDKKSGYIDDRIEEDIQYFASNYSQKQK
jgi:hypothetical protein